MEDINELAKQISQLRAAQSSLNILMEGDRATVAAAEKEEKRLSEEHKRSRERLSEANDTARRNKVHSVNVSRELRDLLYRFEILNAEHNRKKALQEKAVKFDLDTAEAMWRKGNKRGKKAFPHQINGAKFLAAVSRAVCADKRGLGKSLTAIAACDMAKANRILIVSPYDVVTNFYMEFVDWSPRPLLFKLSDMPRNVREAMLPTLRGQDSLVVFTNYESLRDKSTVDHLKAIRFDTIITDEAHIMKESSSVPFRAVTKLVYDVNICPQCIVGCEFAATDEKETTLICRSCAFIFEPKHVEMPNGRSVERIWPLTGTPILNRPQEMFTLLHLIDRDLFKTERQFLDRYCVHMGGTRWKFTPGGEKELMERISSFFLRRTPEMAGIEFPAQTETFYELELKEADYPKQYAFYKLLRDRAVIELREGKVVGVINAMALLTRLRQAIVFPYGIAIKDPDTGEIVDRCDVTESVKLDWTFDQLQSIMDEDETNAGIVFSQFKPGLRELARRLNKEGIRSVVLDGETPAHIREQIKIDFDSKRTALDSPNRRWDIVLANYKVGGTGLNLSRANHTVILDEEWNPGKIDQAYGRSNRLDSLRPSYVHVPQVKGTVDSKMRRIITDKFSMIQGFDTEATRASEVEDMIHYILNPEDN